MRAKWTAAALVIALVILPGCAATQIARQKHDLRQQIAAVASAYRNLAPNSTSQYNASLELLGRDIERDSPTQFQQELIQSGVKWDRPAIKLPLAHCQVVRRPQGLLPNSAGVPVLLQFDTSQASVYPPDGLLIAGTLIYKRSGQTAHLFPVTGESSIELNGTRYPLAIDNYALGAALRHRTKTIAQIGLHRMLHPAATGPKTQIYPIDPYDPNKIPLLLVHGLQSNPVTFLSLVNAIRMDPELSPPLSGLDVLVRFWHSGIVQCTHLTARAGEDCARG